MAMDVITWAHVPRGTRLEVSVAPADGSLLAVGDIFRVDKGQMPSKQWSDNDLRPGPASERLKDGADYIIDSRPVSMSGQAATGKVTAVLLTDMTGTELTREERPFTLQPQSHHLVRIFVDSDPLPMSEAGERERAFVRAPRRRGGARASGRRKKGK